MGDHRLYCGSALDAAAYDILLGSTKAAAVFTDPPYNVKVDGHVCGSSAIKHREFAMASGEMSEDEFTRFLTETLELAGFHADGGAIVYACMDWRHMGEILAASRAAGFDLLNLCVWVKSNGGMGSLYRSRHELVFVFKHGKEAHCNIVQLGRFGRNRTNVWNYAGSNSFPRRGQRNALDLHPTVKPIAFPMPFWIQRSAMTSFWILIVTAARPCSLPSAPAGAVTASRSIPFMWTPQSSVGRG
jgi:DNA modification methylase